MRADELADITAEAILDGRDAGLVVLRQDPDGGWIWAWERPDGSCVFGTAADCDVAADRAAQTIKDWYADAH